MRCANGTYIASSADLPRARAVSQFVTSTDDPVGSSHPCAWLPDLTGQIDRHGLTCLHGHRQSARVVHGAGQVTVLIQRTGSCDFVVTAWHRQPECTVVRDIDGEGLSVDRSYCRDLALDDAAVHGLCDAALQVKF